MKFFVYLPFLLLLLAGNATFSQNEIIDFPDSLINNWHRDAAQANLDSYFKVLGDDFVFLGTAPNERWDKMAFKSFCKPYFDKGKAWSFVPSNRLWVLSPDKKTAWFDEDLSTWMGGCRGSGICILAENKWVLMYYNLTVLIENEKINSFIKLRQE